MNFEHPDVFYALPVLAIPVIVHLFNFRKRRKIIFSSIQFLEEIHQQQAAYTQLRERRVLIMRLLAVLFIILAFSRPYFANQKELQNQVTSKIISVFVDNSYSMQTLNHEGNLLDEARKTAKQIASVNNTNTQFQLLTQNFSTAQQHLLSAAEFSKALDTITYSYRSNTLQQILSRQQSLAAGQSSLLKKRYVISDFQRNLFTRKPLVTDNAEDLNLIRVSTQPLPNIAIDSVSLINAIHRPGVPEKLAVSIRNYSNQDISGVPVKLLVNGSQRAAGNVSLKAHTAITDTLLFTITQAGWQQAKLLLQDNPVTFDNTFYFAFEAKPSLSLLIINGAGTNPFLTAAFETDKFFKPVQVSSSHINYTTLNGYPATIFNNVKDITPGMAQQLQAYVKQGGILIVFPADGAELQTYRRLLQPLNAAWPQQLVKEGTRVTFLNTTNPVFNGVFQARPDKAALPVVNQYYNLGRVPANSNNLIMQLPGDLPFISGYSSGFGNTFVFAVPLDEAYSDLPKHALLLPLLFKMVLPDNNHKTIYNYISTDQQLSFSGIVHRENQILHLDRDQQKIIPDFRQNGYTTTLYLADQIRQPGIYRLMAKDSLIADFAFNHNRSESDLYYPDDKTISKLLPAKVKLISSLQGFKDIEQVSLNTNLQLWKVSLILALLSIAAEILFIRYKRTDINTQTTS